VTVIENANRAGIPALFLKRMVDQGSIPCFSPGFVEIMKSYSVFTE